MKHLVTCLLFLLALVILTGCQHSKAVQDEDEIESDMPWNIPQTWEGAPGIPGLNER